MRRAAARHEPARVKIEAETSETKTGKRTRPPRADWTAAYLESLSRNGKRVDAATAAGIIYSTAFRRRKSDPLFAQAEDEALNMALATWEQEAIRRAVDGCAHEKFDSEGRLLSKRVEYSDVLLLRLLERLDPTWRQKQQVEHSGGVAFESREDRQKTLEQARREFAVGTN